MQKGYIQIGDDKNRKIVGDTTYSVGISADKGNQSLKKDEDNRKHLVGSINLGSNSIQYESETKSK
jgi:hypothetical protein